MKNRRFVQTASVAWIAATALLFMTAAVIGASDESVTLMPHWKQGEKLQYEIVKTRQRPRLFFAPLKATSRTPLDIEVVKATADGYVLRWTLGEPKTDDPKQTENPLAKDLVNLVSGFQLLLEVNTSGTLCGVQNWKEIKALMEKMMEAIRKRAEESGEDMTAIRSALATAASMFSSREQIEMFCTREAQLFLLPLGKTYSTSEPLKYETELPNPFGGDPFPSDREAALKDFDRKSGRATVTWKQTLRPEETNRILEATIKKLAASMGKSAGPGGIPKTFMIQDTGEFLIDVPSGWTQSFTHKRTVNASGNVQEDTVAIMRKAD